MPGNDGSDGLFVAIDALPNVAEGGAVANVAGGTLDVSHCSFTDNQAVGTVRGTGGALAILSGTAAIQHTTIAGNDARGSDGTNGGDGQGGGVYVGGGTVTIQDCKNHRQRCHRRHRRQHRDGRHRPGRRHREPR